MTDLLKEIEMSVERAIAAVETIQAVPKTGDALDLKTALCYESRIGPGSIIIDKFSEDPQYCGHHTGDLYQLESYIPVLIIKTLGKVSEPYWRPASSKPSGGLGLASIYANRF